MNILARNIKPAVNASRRVAILAPAPVALFELGVGVEFFAMPRPDIPGWYQGQVLSVALSSPQNAAEGLAASGGVSVQAEPYISLDDFDDVLMPYWPVGVEAPAAVLEGINKLAARGGRVWSFCSGAFLLAQTNLLAERAVTTHWLYREKLLEQHPGLHYHDDVLYHYDGRVGCSAGSAAAIDLGMEIVRQDFGHDIAKQVARRLVASPQRRGSQAQFVQTPLPKFPDGLAPSLDWAIENLHQAISVDTLAQRANMSRRSYDRKFRASFNVSPKAWLTQQRLGLAKQLLEAGGQQALPMEPLAAASGFENAASLRHHFRRVFGLAPGEYRRQFQQH